jgi:hypothetical protein
MESLGYSSNAAGDEHVLGFKTEGESAWIWCNGMFQR